MLEIIAIAGNLTEQPFGLLAGLQMLLLLEQHHRVIEACLVIVRRALRGGFEKSLCFSRSIPIRADACQQAQGADIAAILSQIVPQDILRRSEIAIGIKAVCHHQFGRQLLQHRQIPGRHGRTVDIARHAEKLFQHVPGGGQCGVQSYRNLQGLDGGGAIAEQDMAVAPLLIQAAEARVVGLQPGENGQCLSSPPFGAQTSRFLQQFLAVVGNGKRGHRRSLARSSGWSQPGSGWSMS